jgi:hypothetical protein
LLKDKVTDRKCKNIVVTCKQFLLHFQLGLYVLMPKFTLFSSLIVYDYSTAIFGQHFEEAADF